MLLSGGLDSLVALAQARRKGEVALALTFDYGQRSAPREVAAARAAARAAGVPHRVVPLPFLAAITATALVRRARPLPAPSEGELDRRGAAARSAAAVWVPNRNGVFVAVAAAHAEAWGVRDVVVGFNREEGATFPDNTPEFVRRMNRLLERSTLRRPPPRVWAPLARLDKAGIVRRGIRLGAPFDLFWSCYRGGRRMCGRCESCRRALRAFRRAGALDRVLPRFVRGPGMP